MAVREFPRRLREVIGRTLGWKFNVLQCAFGRGFFVAGEGDEQQSVAQALIRNKNVRLRQEPLKDGACVGVFFPAQEEIAEMQTGREERRLDFMRFGKSLKREIEFPCSSATEPRRSSDSPKGFSRDRSDRVSLGQNRNDRADNPSGPLR